MIKAVPRGEEEDVHICRFTCDCGSSFVVQCRMCDTARCYACRKKEVGPHSFEPLRPIRTRSDNVHSCSRCPKSGGPCPNKSRQERVT